MDLDLLALEPGPGAVARDRAAARTDLDAFCAAHERRVVAGCHAGRADEIATLALRAG